MMGYAVLSVSEMRVQARTKVYLVHVGKDFDDIAF